MDRTEASKETMRDVVIANRILAKEEIMDEYGHVSIRSPDTPDRYFLSRARSPCIVELSDVMELDLDSRPMNDQGQRLYYERAIHGEIYRARPDVNAVVHFHSRPILPFAGSDVPLRPNFHPAAVIGVEVPVWDSQEEFGDTNLLVEGSKMGASLARKLGKGNAILMRRHGAVTTGRDIKAAIFNAIYMTSAAQVLLQTLMIGKPSYLTPGEVELFSAKIAEGPGLQRAWDCWVARAGLHGL